MQQKTRWMAICLLAGLCTGPVGATMITSLQTGQTWAGNIVAGSEVDLSLTNSSPWNNGGFVFSSPNNDIRAQNIILHGITPTPGVAPLTSTEMTIAMPSGGETAVYLSLYNLNGSSNGGGTLNLMLSNGTSISGYGPDFWFSSSDPVTSLTLSANNQPFLAQISYATSILAAGSSNPGGTSPVPEPATFLLVSGGALILFGAGRRWFRRDA